MLHALAYAGRRLGDKHFSEQKSEPNTMLGHVKFVFVFGPQKATVVVLVIIVSSPGSKNP